MTPRYNSEDGQWHWWSDDTGWGDVLTDAEIAEAKAKGQIPTEEVGQGDFVSNILAGLTGTKTFRSEHPREWNELQQWNAQQKLADSPTLTDAQGQEAMKYVGPLGLDFTDALDVYSNWLYKPELGLPAPDAASRWVEQQAAAGEEPKGLIQRLLAGAGRITARAGAVTAGLPTGAETTPVGQAILAVTADPTVQAAMWAGAGNEGGTTGPWGTAPGGPSVGGAGEVGPWQIHPIHFKNIAPEAAADPNAAALYMLPRYEDAVKSVPAEVWQSDPGGALTLAIANAERPGGWHENLTVEEAVTIYGGRATAPAGITPTGIADLGPYRPAGAGGELTYTERALNEVLPKPIDVAILQAAKREMGWSGGELIYNVARELGLPVTFAELDLTKLGTTLETLNTRYRTAWTPEDLTFILSQALTEEDLGDIAGAGQKPRDWWIGRFTEVDKFLKAANIPWPDLAEGVRYDLTIPLIQLMGETKLSAMEMNVAAIQRGLSDDQIRLAVNRGINPATMSPTQEAQLKRDTDIGLAVEAHAANLPPDVGEAFRNQAPYLQDRYTAAKTNAMARGEFVTAMDFLSDINLQREVINRQIGEHGGGVIPVAVERDHIPPVFTTTPGGWTAGIERHGYSGFGPLGAYQIGLNVQERMKQAGVTVGEPGAVEKAQKYWSPEEYQKREGQKPLAPLLAAQPAAPKTQLAPGLLTPGAAIPGLRKRKPKPSPAESAAGRQTAAGRGGVRF